MRRRGLRSAVAKLEVKRRLVRSKMPVIFGLYSDEDGGDVIGLAVIPHGPTVDRLVGEEELGAFALRAVIVLGDAYILVARYAPIAELKPAPAPEELPHGVSRASAALFG